MLQCSLSITSKNNLLKKVWLRSNLFLFLELKLILHETNTCYFSFYNRTNFLSRKKTFRNLIEKGISYELATYRKLQVTDVKYKLTFDIPESKSEIIPSKLKLSVTINDLTNDLFLILMKRNRTLNRLPLIIKVLKFNHDKEHLIISKNI